MTPPAVSAVLPNTTTQESSDSHGLAGVGVGEPFNPSQSQPGGGVVVQDLPTPDTQDCSDSQGIVGVGRGGTATKINATQVRTDSQWRRGGVETRTQPRIDSQEDLGAGCLTSSPNTPTQKPAGSQDQGGGGVGVDLPADTQKGLDSQDDDGVGGYSHEQWVTLRWVAATFEDAQHLRMATAARARQAVSLTGLVTTTTTAENEIKKVLEKTFASVAPREIRDWQKATPGIGVHTLALLLGTIGHPRIGIPKEFKAGTGEPSRHEIGQPFYRRIRELYAYCGVGAVIPRQRGMAARDARARGNRRARQILYLMSEKAIVQPGRRWTPELGGHWASDAPEQDRDDTQRSGDSQTFTGAVTPPPRSCAAAKSVAVGELRPTPMEETKAKSKPVLEDPARNPTQEVVDSQLRIGGEPGGPVGPHTQIPVESQRPLGVWPYRALYEQARNHYHDHTHNTECPRCGPAGHPAQPGDPWTPGHQHNAALRLVAKQILRDIHTATPAPGQDTP